MRGPVGKGMKALSVRSIEDRAIDGPSGKGASRATGVYYEVEKAVIRNFLSGIVFGGVIAGLGLAVISQVTPLPGRPEAANSTVAPAPAAEAAVAQAEVQPAAPVADDSAPVPEAVAEVAPEPAPEPAPEAAPEPAQPEVSVEPTAPEAPVAGMAVPDLPASGDSAPAAPALADRPVMPDADTPQVGSDLPPPAAPPEVAEPLLTPLPEAIPAPPAEITLDQPAVPDSPKPEPQPEATAEAPAQPAPDTPAEPAIILPTLPEPGLGKTVDGVTTGRLPSIAAADPAPVADAPAEVVLDDPRPLVKFARAFSNDAGKPAFAVVLIDTGAADLDRAALASLPFPVSFVLDPLDPSAAAAAAAYRAGGQEVIMLASGIPRGANPSDLEQTFQSNERVLPETVAVMDAGSGGGTGGFQDDRQLAAQVVPLIKAQGRGLLTFDRGLNAADQVARREGVAAAVIFRELDAGDEDTPLIRRYLDRAAFKAAQEGRVVVLGTTRPETIAALMEWAVEGRASSVALAPLTAVMVTQ